MTYNEFLKMRKKEKEIIKLSKIFIVIITIISWEALARLNILNTFLYSSPSKVLKCIYNLFRENNIIKHISITVSETLISFTLSTIIAFLMGTILWCNKKIEKILDPFINLINSLPKVALAPLIIIWFGANTKSIVFMGILISVFTSTINLTNHFNNTNKNYIMLIKTMNASKKEIFKYVVIPSNKGNIINILKVNISLTLIGIITGELLVSKEGLGYLITYGTQIFDITLIITSIFILIIISHIFYIMLIKIEKKSKKKQAS